MIRWSAGTEHPALVAYYGQMFAAMLRPVGIEACFAAECHANALIFPHQCLLVTGHVIQECRAEAPAPDRARAEQAPRSALRVS
jgi:hypothetical protein